MPTKVSICNQAIALLGGNPITSLDEDTTEARLCNTLYDDLRRAVLEEMNWSFAITAFDLGAPSAEKDPVSGNNKFVLHPDILRVVKAYDGNGNELSDWELLSREIITSSAVCIVRAIFDQVVTTTYSQGFCQALSARLAAELAIPLTNSATVQGSMWSIFAQKLQLARTNDGLQGRGMPLGDGRLVNARKRLG